MHHLRATQPADRPTARRSSRRSAGFTLIEMVITLAILVVVMLGVMALFDMASKISRVQVDVADVQQTLRAAQYDMVRMIRMAGRGSVPVQGPLPPGAPGPTDWVIPRGIAFGVDNNVAAGTFIDPGPDTRRVLAGTDVITVRGVISTPVLNVVDRSFARNPGDGRGSLRVINQVQPGVPVPQNLQALDDAITANPAVPEALILVSPLDDSFYHIVELDPETSIVNARDVDGNATDITVGFRSEPGDSATGRLDAYWELSGNNWDAQLVNVAMMGIVEEYKYWIEDVRDVEGDQTSQVSPRLARSRFFPGTTDPYGGAVDLAQPVAENVADLQVALGVEWPLTAPEPGSLAIDVSAFEPADDGTEDDEWLYNHGDDDDTLEGWRGGKLYYIRLSTTTVAPRIDRDYLGPANEAVEDHSYAVPDPGTSSPGTPDRRHRRRTLRTLIDLRNL